MVYVFSPLTTPMIPLITIINTVTDAKLPVRPKATTNKSIVVLTSARVVETDVLKYPRTIIARTEMIAKPIIISIALPCSLSAVVNSPILISSKF